MVEGDIGGKMVAGVVDHAGDFQVRDGSRGDSVGKDGPHPKREGVVQGHSTSRGSVEDVLSGG